MFSCLFGVFFKAKDLPTFKDNDFLNEGHKLQIGDDNKKYFLEKLKRDVEVRFESASVKRDPRDLTGVVLGCRRVCFSYMFHHMWRFGWFASSKQPPGFPFSPLSTLN